MGADSALVCFGVRSSIPEVEHMQLESRSDLRQRAARRCQLDFWWGRFLTDRGKEVYYLLLIGANFASIGHEGQAEVCRSLDDLAAPIDAVGRTPEQAGIEQLPKLYVQFAPEY